MSLKVPVYSIRTVDGRIASETPSPTHICDIGLKGGGGLCFCNFSETKSQYQGLNFKCYEHYQRLPEKKMCAFLTIFKGYHVSPLSLTAFHSTISVAVRKQL